MRLKNKVAIVTGGASGIGAATCRLYAQEGAAGIVVADINEEAGRSVAGSIVQAGGEAIFIHLDVSVESQWIDTVNATIERYNRLDITVNNAGMSVAESRVKVEDTTVEIWNRLHAVNSTGVFLGAKHSIPPMRENHWVLPLRLPMLTGIYVLWLSQFLEATTADNDNINMRAERC